jgi:hypothetical protein
MVSAYLLEIISSDCPWFSADLKIIAEVHGVKTHNIHFYVKSIEEAQRA